MGTAMMGTGESTGERRAVLAAEEAISNPLLDDVTLRGARGLLLSISGGSDMTLYEVDEAASRVREEVDPEANIIVGATFDEQLGDRIRVSIVASGMNKDQMSAPHHGQRQAAGMMLSGSGQAEMASMANSYPAQPRSPRDAGAEPPPTGDLQRRLSEALHTAPQHQASNFAPSGHAERPHSARDTWIAPGKVVVEDGLENFPPLAGNALLKTPPLPPPPHGGMNAPYFEPQPPTDIPRTSRRLPAIEDFPPQAQRQWSAHHGGPAASPDSGAELRRKQGLLGRLTGFGRKVAVPKSSSRTNVAHAYETEDDDAQMPVFFSRDGR
jgi:cell division protein FtsZ